MVRDLNGDHLNPLKTVFPAHRLGPEGDGPKVACETCHKGAFKPLYGVSVLGDYPELAGPIPAPAAPPAGEAEAQPTSEPETTPPSEPGVAPAVEASPAPVTQAL